MTAPAVCGEKYPHRRGIICTRPAGHAGGHLCEPYGEYWQAEDAQVTA